MMQNETIVFMGTPDFAVPTLTALHEAGARIPLVVTQPDRPSGRGRKLTAPPVKRTAEALGLPVAQPTSVKPQAFIDALRETAPTIIVVVAFGQILPGALLAVPTAGAINVHASLLPKYRGPAPIQHAIIDGETETGITTMQMAEGLDTGDILLTERTPIAADDTAQSLHDRLARLGADLLVTTLERMREGRLESIPQDHAAATYAPMLTKADGHIDWSRPAEEIERRIRGVYPWPGAFTFHKGQRLKLFSGHIHAGDRIPDEPPGTVVARFDDEMTVATGRGYFVVDEIQSLSGKRLSARDFLNGYCIFPNDTLS